MDLWLDLFEKGDKEAGEEAFETVTLKSIIDAIVNFVKAILSNEFGVEL